MSDTVNYPPADQPTTPVPAAKKPKPWKHIIGYTATALVFFGFGSAGGGSEDPASTAAVAAASSTTSSSTTEPAEETTTTTTEAAPPPPHVLSRADLKLTTKILSKECFGSAGCNVTFRIKMAYVGPGTFPDGTYEVGYTVKGAEDPLQGTIDVEDGQYDPPEESVSTKRKSSKLVVVTTDVERTDS